MGFLYDPQNVVVGAAMAYFAAVGETPPASTVKFGTPWGGDWINPGGTEDGYRLTADSSTQSHTIEEQPNPVLVTLETRGLGIAASLAEDTLDSLRLAFAGGTITVAGSGLAVKTFQLATGIEEFAVGLDMDTVAGVTRRIIIPRASGAGSVDVAFRRSASKRLWPIQFSALCPPEDIIIQDIPLA